MLLNLDLHLEVRGCWIPLQAKACWSPGNVMTESLQVLGLDYHAAMAAAVPLGRLGRLEDIANKKAVKSLLYCSVIGEKCGI